MRARPPLVWVLATIGVIVVLLVVSTLVRIPEQEVPQARVEPVRVTFSPIDRDLALRQQLELFDPSPLILPNPYSTEMASLPASFKREPGVAFGAFLPPARFGESTPLLTLRTTLPAPDRPVDAFLVGTRSEIADAMGESDLRTKSFAQRTLRIEIMRPATGELIFEEDVVIDPKARPEGELPGAAELLLAVDRAGIVAPPIIVTGTGKDNWDGFLRNDLARISRLGQRLPSGVYRIRLGP